MSHGIACCGSWFEGGGGGYLVMVHGTCISCYKWKGREGSTLTEKMKTTNDNEYHHHSSSGCHVTDSNVAPGVSTLLHICHSSFRNVHPLSWMLPLTWHAR
jgi:hypothetical protein